MVCAVSYITVFTTRKSFGFIYEFLKSASKKNTIFAFFILFQLKDKNGESMIFS